MVSSPVRNTQNDHRLTIVLVFVGFKVPSVAPGTPSGKAHNEDEEEKSDGSAEEDEEVFEVDRPAPSTTSKQPATPKKEEKKRKAEALVTPSKRE